MLGLGQKTWERVGKIIDILEKSLELYFFNAMKKKKRPKDRYPIHDEFPILISVGNEIVTDAGWETLSFEDACQFFSAEELREWYSSYWESCDFDDLLAELGININREDEEAVEEFFDNYDWTPKTVDVIVAKAVSEFDSWVRVMALPHFDKINESLYFSHWEEQAILLGVQLRKSLGLDIPIINDCQDAVRNKRRKYAKIFWCPRGYVGEAHNLKIARATKIYTHQLWEEEWEEEWDEYPHEEWDEDENGFF